MLYNERISLFGNEDDQLFVYLHQLFCQLVHLSSAAIKVVGFVAVYISVSSVLIPQFLFPHLSFTSISSEYLKIRKNSLDRHVKWDERSINVLL